MAQPHFFLNPSRLGKGRHRLAHDFIVREEMPRLFLQLRVPDRADAGVVPADNVIALRRWTGDSSRRRENGGSSTKCGNATHEKSPEVMGPQAPRNGRSRPVRMMAPRGVLRQKEGARQ